MISNVPFYKQVPISAIEMMGRGNGHLYVSGFSRDQKLKTFSSRVKVELSEV